MPNIVQNYKYKDRWWYKKLLKELDSSLGEQFIIDTLDLYEKRYAGSIDKFPDGFWQSVDGKHRIKIVLTFIFDEIEKLDMWNIYINLNQNFLRKYKLGYLPILFNLNNILDLYCNNFLEIMYTGEINPKINSQGLYNIKQELWEKIYNHIQFGRFKWMFFKNKFYYSILFVYLKYKFDIIMKYDIYEFYDNFKLNILGLAAVNHSGGQLNFETIVKLYNTNYLPFLCKDAVNVGNSKCSMDMYVYNCYKYNLDCYDLLFTSYNFSTMNFKKDKFVFTRRNLEKLNNIEFIRKIDKISYNNSTLEQLVYKSIRMYIYKYGYFSIYEFNNSKNLPENLYSRLSYFATKNFSSIYQCKLIIARGIKYGLLEYRDLKYVTPEYIAKKQKEYEDPKWYLKKEIKDFPITTEWEKYKYKPEDTYMSHKDIYIDTIENDKEFPPNYWERNGLKPLNEILTYLIEEKYKLSNEDIYNLDENFFIDNRLGRFVLPEYGDMVSDLFKLYDNSLLGYKFKYKKVLTKEDIDEIVLLDIQNNNMTLDDVNSLDSSYFKFRNLITEEPYWEILKRVYPKYNIWDSLKDLYLDEPKQLFYHMCRRLYKTTGRFNKSDITMNWIRANGYDRYISEEQLNEISDYILDNAKNIDTSEIELCSLDWVKLCRSKYKDFNWLKELP